MSYHRVAATSYRGSSHPPRNPTSRSAHRASSVHPPARGATRRCPVSRPFGLNAYGMRYGSEGSASFVHSEAWPGMTAWFGVKGPRIVL